MAVKAIKPGPFGDTITLHDGLKASELVLQLHGKLRQVHEHEAGRSLAEILAGMATLEKQGA